MFPKKRKQKEKNLSPSKISKLETKKTPEQLPSPTKSYYTSLSSSSKSNTPFSSPTSSVPPTPTIKPDNFSPYTDTSPNKDLLSPPSSIPHTPTGDPIISLDSHTINSSSEMLLLQKLDMLNKPSPPAISQPTDTLAMLNKPSPPAISQPTDTLVMPSIVNWSSLYGSFTRPSSPTPGTSSDFPLDMSRLEEYASSSLISDEDWSHVEDFLNESSKSITMPNPEAPQTSTLPDTFTSVFSLEDLISSTILNPQTDSQIITPMVPSTPQTSSMYNPIQILDDDDDDDDNDNLLTSDDIFKIMKYICDATNNKDYLTSSPFSPIAKHMPYLQNSIDHFNGHIYNMSMAPHTRKETSIYLMDMKNICIRICTTIKEKYLNIYPAKQILALIQSNPNTLTCLPILEHEEGIKNHTHRYKEVMAHHARYSLSKEKTVKLRLDIIRNLVYIIEEGFKKIYNLE